MSTDADIIALLSQSIIGTYATFASNGEANLPSSVIIDPSTFFNTAWIAYEHLFMFNYEVDFLLKRKWGAATWIFIVNRYLLIGKIIFQAIPFGPQRRCELLKVVLTYLLTESTDSCGNYLAMNFLTFLFDAALPIIPVAAFSILRTFALIQPGSLRSIVCWLLVFMNLFVFATNSFIAFGATWTYSDIPPLGPSCATLPSNSLTAAVYTRQPLVQFAISTIGIVSDAIPLVVILVNTFRQVIRAYSLRLPVSLSYVLLRDCSLFFLIQLVLAIIEVAPVVDGSSPAIFALPPFFDALPLILLSRFVVNLRQTEKPDDGPTTQNVSRFTGLNFRMPTMDDVVGNLGETLDFTPEDTTDYEDVADETTQQGEQAELTEIGGITRGHEGSSELFSSGDNDQVLA